MNDKVYCLMRNGPGLTEKHRTVLFMLALKLYQSNGTRKRFKTTSFEGMITTQRSWAHIGSMLGMKFSAEVSGDGGTLKIDYLVRPCDLPELEGKPFIWGLAPIEHIESFADLASSN